MTAASIPAASPAAIIDGINVDAVAAVVLACAAVSALDGGQYGDVTSYLPGRTLAGVAVTDGRVKVQVRARWVPAPELAAGITAALAPLIGTRPVDILITDIDEPPAAPVPAAGLPPVARLQEADLSGLPSSPQSGCES